MDLWQWAPVPSDLPIYSGSFTSVNALSDRQLLAVTSHSAKKLEVNHSALNCFVFYVRGFGCAQNQVLSTFGKSAQCTKSGTYRGRSVVRRKKTGHCNSWALFTRKALTKNFNVF